MPVAQLLNEHDTQFHSLFNFGNISNGGRRRSHGEAVLVLDLCRNLDLGGRGSLVRGRLGRDAWSSSGLFLQPAFELFLGCANNAAEHGGVVVVMEEDWD